MAAMIKSMTGFAQREIAQAGFRASLGIKSYNNRYLDLSISLPPYLSKLEPRLRSFLSERIVHGKVEAWLRVREFDAPVEASADMAAAKAVAGVLSRIVEACGIKEPIGLASILGFDGVVSFDREVDDEAIWARVFPEVEACFADYEATRLREGASTRADVEASLARVASSLVSVREQVPEIERTVRSQLGAKFKDLLGDAVDEGRVLTEIASALMKYTVNEELSRLSAHLGSFSRIMDTEGSPGKKLDFLCQEMNREVNTIGSKSMLLAVSREVVELKDALENIREQLRNVE
jgi:uncharacterized protein (TIGR00255 family)